MTSFPISITLISFSCLIALVSASTTILKRREDKWTALSHSWFWWDCFKFVSIYDNVGFTFVIYIPYLGGMSLPFLHSLGLSSASIEMIMWFFFFLVLSQFIWLNVHWLTYMLSLLLEFLDKANMIIVMIFLICACIWVASILLSLASVFIRDIDWSVLFVFCCIFYLSIRVILAS